MQYRSTEYSVIQEENRSAWRWTVNVNENTVESGTAKTREAALAAVVLTIDRWKARTRLIQLNVPRGRDDTVAVV